ncbi:MAG: hypothetical protein WA945_06995 [Arcobacteraceae bacterium]
MKKSIEILEKISSQCVAEKSSYEFSKTMDKSDKYRKGRVDALNWINDIIYHFIQKERNFINEFKEHINTQKIIISNIKEGDYKKALYDS